MQPDSVPLWKLIGQESVWGRRGIARIKTLFLPLSVILTTAKAPEERSMAPVCLFLFLSTVCWSLAAILANDLTDKEDDGSAGKNRWICRLPAGASAMVVSGIILAGLGILALASPGKTSVLWDYGAATALALLYSAKPIRFKERGVWGLIEYGLTCVAGYVLVPWTLVGASWISLAILAAAVFADKWVNLHFHQVMDYEADRLRGTKTYAVVVGLDRARISLRIGDSLASLLLFLVFLYVAFFLGKWWLAALLIVGGVVAGKVLHSWNASKASLVKSELLRELSFRYLGLTYAATCILPPILFARLAFAEPAMWIVVAAVGFLVVVNSHFSLQYRYR